MSEDKRKPVQQRITDSKTAYQCLCALACAYRFGEEEVLFEEDVVYSLKLIKNLTKGATP